MSFDGQEIKPPTCPPQEAVAGLKRKFQSLLQNLAQSRPESLRQILLQVYGSKLSEKPELLEHLIRLASQGKLPLPVRIELVPAEALRNNHAAYSHQDGGTIYLNQDLLSAPETLNAAFLEEMGHHLDHQLGGSDTPGDEGEAFMRALLKQAPLSDGQLAQVRSDQDQGQITVHGQTLTVEFQASGTVTAPATPKLPEELIQLAQQGKKLTPAELKQLANQYLHHFSNIGYLLKTYPNQALSADDAKFEQYAAQIPLILAQHAAQMTLDPDTLKTIGNVLYDGCSGHRELDEKFPLMAQKAAEGLALVAGKLSPPYQTRHLATLLVRNLCNSLDSKQADAYQTNPLIIKGLAELAKSLTASERTTIIDSCKNLLFQDRFTIPSKSYLHRLMMYGKPENVPNYKEFNQPREDYTPDGPRKKMAIAALEALAPYLSLDEAKHLIAYTDKPGLTDITPRVARIMSAALTSPETKLDKQALIQTLHQSPALTDQSDLKATLAGFAWEKVGLTGKALQWMIQNAPAAESDQGSFAAMVSSLSKAGIDRLNQDPELLDGLISIYKELLQAGTDPALTQRVGRAGKDLIEDLKAYLETADAGQLAQNLLFDEAHGTLPKGFSKSLFERLQLQPFFDEKVPVTIKPVKVDIPAILEMELRSFINEILPTLEAFDPEMARQIKENPLDYMKGLVTVIGDANTLKKIISFVRENLNDIKLAAMGLNRGGSLLARTWAKVQPVFAGVFMLIDSAKFAICLAKTVQQPSVQNYYELHKSEMQLTSDVAGMLPGMGSLVSGVIDSGLLGLSAGEWIGKQLLLKVGDDEATSSKGNEYLSAVTQGKMSWSEYFIRNASDGSASGRIKKNGEQSRKINEQLNQDLAAGLISEAEAALLRLSARIDRNGSYIESDQTYQQAVTAAMSLVNSQSVGDTVYSQAKTLLLMAGWEQAYDKTVPSLPMMHSQDCSTHSDKIKAGIATLQKALDQEQVAISAGKGNPVKALYYEEQLERVRYLQNNGQVAGGFSINYSDLFNEMWHGGWESYYDLRKNVLGQ
ncbi:MAG: hypothetical protein ACAI44_32590 [Candidatus Sericytochromatia bacterium]